MDVEFFIEIKVLLKFAELRTKLEDFKLKKIDLSDQENWDELITQFEERKQKLLTLLETEPLSISQPQVEEFLNNPLEIKVLIALKKIGWSK